MPTTMNDAHRIEGHTTEANGQHLHYLQGLAIVCPVISRLWRARCTPEHAEAYEALLLTKILPELDKADGCLGAYVMRRQAGSEIEFAVLHLFDSLAAIKAFAGDNYKVAVVPAEARALLASFDPAAQHFEVRAAPDNRTLGPVRGWRDVPSAPEGA